MQEALMLQRHRKFYWQFRVGSLLNICSHLYSVLISIFSLYFSSCSYDCIRNHPKEKQMVFRIAVSFRIRSGYLQPQGL